MRTYAERQKFYDLVDRTAKLATTYLRKASNLIYAREGAPLLTQYWTLLDQALDTATDIVEALPDSFFESAPMEDWLGLRASLPDLEWDDKFNSSDAPLEAAEKLVAALVERRARVDVLRKIRALEDVTGRSEEEAAPYLAGAARLRAKHGLEES